MMDGIIIAATNKSAMVKFSRKMFADFVLNFLLDKIPAIIRAFPVIPMITKKVYTVATATFIVMFCCVQLVFQMCHCRNHTLYVKVMKDVGRFETIRYVTVLCFCTLLTYI